MFMTSSAISNGENQPQSPGYAEEQLERQMILGLLVGGIVHEMANPLNAILMNAELGQLYLQQDGDSEELAQVLRTIAEEAKRGGVLGQGLLSFARSVDYAPQTTGNLNDVIAHAGKLLGSNPRRNNVDLALQKSEALPVLMINPLALALALAGLVDRLIWAGAKQIEVAALSHAGEIVLTLRTGNPASLDLAKDRYTEVMLSFARRVLQAHGGKIETASGVLSLHFPLTEPPADN